MKLPIVQHRTVFVTGCSTGIGRATARLLRQHGWRVLAGARKPADLESLAKEGFTPVEIDLANPASVEAAARAVSKSTDGLLGALVNNAGFGQPGALEDVSRDVLRSQFEVNVFGLQDLTNRLLPAMIKAENGRIVHISSVLGKVAIPLMGAYCAAKHAVEALADAQRVELRETGVGLIVVEPGPITSEFRNTAAAIGQSTLRKQTRIPMPDMSKRTDGSGAFTLPPEAVARKIVHALESSNPKRRYRVTIPAYGVPLAKALLPEAAYDWLAARRLKRKRG